MQTVKNGNRGVYVEYVQLALQRSGYLSSVDGIFGPNTERAVKRIQAENRLSPDGIVGPLTWEVLTPYLRGYAAYTVRAGDTIYNLARRFYTTEARITTANPSLRPENLSIGARLLIPYGFPLVPTNVLYSYPLLKLLYEGFLVRYPFIKGNTAGTSLMGQNLYYFQMGEGENEVFYNGAHHANEWITTPLLLRFLEEYAESYISGGTIGGLSAASLYARTTLYLLPMVNPDGVDLVTGALSPNSSFYKTARLYADNYPQIPFPNGWKANIGGVDPNLSYPANWEEAREIKFSQGFTSPAPRDFVGNMPLDAPESRAVYDFTRGRFFRLTLSYHTQGKVIFWKYLDYLPPNAQEIGEYFSAVSGYALADTPYESSFAGYKDWFIATYNLPGYTIEAGSGVNPLPRSQFPEIYRDNLGILSSGLGVFTDTP